MVEQRVRTIQSELRRIERDYYDRNDPGPFIMNGGRERFAVCTKNFVDYMTGFIPFAEPKRREYADKIYAIRKEYLNKLLEQSRLVNHFTLFSPVRLYENLTMILSRTDVSSFLDYLGQSRMYREQILHYYRDKDVYHKYRFFTIMEQGEPPDIHFDFSSRNFDKIRQSEEYKKYRSISESINWETRPPLDLESFPRFQYRPVSLSVSAYRILPLFAGLFFIVLVFILITYYCFVRYDVRWMVRFYAQIVMV